jgi:hypothetical protein
MNTYKINFDSPAKFEPNNFQSLQGMVGLYFIFLQSKSINYPSKSSKLIYIGMSEMRTNSIGSRICSHYDGTSGNMGIKNYRSIDNTYFTYLNFEMLKNIWKYRIEDLESYFILDFVQNYGVYPICNNKSGFEVLNFDVNLKLLINWQYFE